MSLFSELMVDTPSVRSLMALPLDEKIAALNEIAKRVRQFVGARDRKRPTGTLALATNAGVFTG